LLLLDVRTEVRTYLRNNCKSKDIRLYFITQFDDTP
jgi:hypothetical protein